VSPTAPITRTIRPPRAEPAIVPGETGLQMRFGQAGVVLVGLSLICVVVVVAVVELGEGWVLVAREEKNVMDSDSTVGYELQA